LALTLTRGKNFKLVNFVIVLSWLACGYLQAQTIKTYDISGNNATELVASMRANGPNGAWALAHNTWRYSYRYTQSAGTYMLTSVEITRIVEITMPNWLGYKSATRCLKDHWDSMYRSLRNHEDNHVKLADPVEALLREAIMGVAATDSKTGFERAIKAATAKVFEENNWRQSRYDLETGHGKDDPIDPVILKSCP